MSTSQERAKQILCQIAKDAQIEDRIVIHQVPTGDDSPRSCSGIFGYQLDVPEYNWSVLIQYRNIGTSEPCAVWDNHGHYKNYSQAYTTEMLRNLVVGNGDPNIGLMLNGAYDKMMQGKHLTREQKLTMLLKDEKWHHGAELLDTVGWKFDSALCNMRHKGMLHIESRRAEKGNTYDYRLVPKVN